MTIADRAGHQNRGDKSTNDVHFLRIKGLSQKTTRSKSLDLVIPRVMGHNLREVVADLGVREGSHIDPTRTKNNVILRGGDTTQSVHSTAQSLMQNVTVTKWRKDTIKAVELVFSLPSASRIDPQNYFEDSVKWAEKYFGVPLLSAVIHLDEDAPHCHVILIPIVDGKLCGSKVMGNSKRIFAMQEDFHKSVAKLHGLARQAPQRYLSASIRREAMDMALKALEATSGLQSEVLRILVEGHRSNPERLLQSLGLAMPKQKIKGTFVDIMIRPCKPEKAKQFSKLAPFGVEMPMPIDVELLMPIEVETPMPIEVETPMPIEVELPMHIEVELLMPIEVEVQMPLEINRQIAPLGHQPLSCVGDEFSAEAFQNDSASSSNSYKRERDNDKASNYWDETRGEFFEPVLKPSTKSQTVKLVNTKIASNKVHMRKRAEENTATTIKANLTSACDGETDGD